MRCRKCSQFTCVLLDRAALWTRRFALKSSADIAASNTATSSRSASTDDVPLPRIELPRDQRDSARGKEEHPCWNECRPVQAAGWIGERIDRKVPCERHIRCWPARKEFCRRGLSWRAKWQFARLHPDRAGTDADAKALAAASPEKVEPDADDPANHKNRGGGQRSPGDKSAEWWG